MSLLRCSWHNCCSLPVDGISVSNRGRFGTGATMNHNVEFKNFQPDPRIRKLIAELINKLEKKPSVFRPTRSF